MYRLTRKHIASLLALLIAASLSVACKGPAAYKAPVTRFRDSSSIVIESTKQFLSALNKTERDHYIGLQMANSAQIQLIRIEEVQAFNPAEIGARIRALDQLQDYTDLLYQLATSNASAASITRANDLNGALGKLSDEVSALNSTDNARFKSAATGAFSLIGEVLRAIIDEKIEAALRRAIAAGDEPVNKLILAIENDARTAYARKRTSLSGLRSASVDAYNTEFLKGPAANSDKLRAYSDLITKTEDRWEAFQTARPVDGLEAMRLANSALVKFADKSKPTVTDFASFVDSMEAFANTARRVGEAVQQIERE